MPLLGKYMREEHFWYTRIAIDSENNIISLLKIESASSPL